MAVDMERLERETSQRKKSSLEAAGDWAKGAWNTVSTGYADPKRERKRLENQTAGNTLDPTAYSGYADRMAPITNEAQRAGAVGQSNAATATNSLLSGYQAPRVNAPAQVQGRDAQVTTSRSAEGTRQANVAMTQGQDARDRQDYTVSLLQRAAEGNGPSQARGLISENAARAVANIDRAGAMANGQFLGAANNAGLAYGNAAGNAQMAYGDAFAGQQDAARLAAINAARQTQDAGAQSIKRQAALIAGARGGNLGASLLAGQNNAATTMGMANRDASRGMFDAQNAASMQAAAQQRQAAANQEAYIRQAAANEAATNIASGQNLSMASIGAREQQALADAQAAQVASQEQIAAMGLLNQGVGQMRGQDLDTARTGVDIGQLGLGMDTLRTNVDMANRDSSIAVQQQNVANDLAAQTTNAQLLAGNQALDASNMNAVADRGQGLYSDTLGLRAGVATDAAGMPIRETELRAELQNAAYDRAYGMTSDAAKGRRQVVGGMMNAAAGALGGLMMSDRRSKEKVKKEAVPDFSRVKSRSWEYKREHKPEGGKGRFVGGMADEYPSHVIEKGEDGMLRVNVAKTLMSLTAAVGDLQRKGSRRAA